MHNQPKESYLMLEPGSPYTLLPATGSSTSQHRTPPWGIKQILFALLFMLGGTLVFSIVLAVAAAIAGLDPAQNTGLRSPLALTVGTGVYLLMLLAVYCFAVRQPHGSWRALGIRGVPWGWLPGTILLVILQLVGMALINTQVLPLFTGVDFQNPQVEAITGGFRLTNSELLFLLLLIGVIGPVAEELFFRGMIYPVMRRRWGAGWTIVLNAAIFALVHFIPLLMPALFYVGLLLAWVRERSNSVIPGILMHIMQNSIVTFGIYTVSQM